jgi:hypothetical protein
LERAGATSELLYTIFKEEDTKALGDHGKQERVARAADSYLVAATIVLTICFTFGFTIPGGYDSSDQKGIAVLAKKLAFKFFIFSDAFALYFALGSTLLLLQIQDEGKIQHKSAKLRTSRGALGMALSLLVISLATGLYASLPTELGILILSLLVFSLVLVLAFISSKFEVWYAPRFWNLLVEDPLLD